MIHIPSALDAAPPHGERDCVACSGSGTLPYFRLRQTCWMCHGEATRGVFVVRLAVGEHEREWNRRPMRCFGIAEWVAHRGAELFRAVARRSAIGNRRVEMRVYYVTRAKGARRVAAAAVWGPKALADSRPT